MGAGRDKPVPYGPSIRRSPAGFRGGALARVPAPYGLGRFGAGDHKGRPYGSSVVVDIGARAP